VPAEPEVIDVPEYDLEVVYERPYSVDFGPALTFGVGFVCWIVAQLRLRLGPPRCLRRSAAPGMEA
jgi:hypothetical protein